MSRNVPTWRLFVSSLPILAGLIPFAGPLRADTIYTNFATGGAYSAGTGMIVTNDGSAWSSVAVAFTPASDYNLTDIEFVATSLAPGDPADHSVAVTLGIFADNGGQPGGAPIEQFTLDGPLAQFGDAAPVLTVTSALQPLLQANTQYWVGMEAPVNGLIVWNQNVSLATGFSYTDGNGNWSASPLDQGVVQIDGILASITTGPGGVVSTQGSVNPVPEPGSWWLISAATLSVLRAKKRARFPHQK